MDYKNTAKEVCKYIGGKENIISAAHCATRLRLVIKENQSCNREALEQVEGVKGVFEASGQLQIIFGTGVVNKVFAEFVKIAEIEEATREEVKAAAAEKQSLWKRAIKTLGDIFVPIIPAIVASGLLMGLLEGLSKAFPAMADSGTYTIIHLFSNAAFVFLPILIAISAAKAFGGNPYLGAVIGMIMIHTDLVNAWSVATAEVIPTATAWFGLLEVKLVGYQGHVIPVVVAVWFMSWIEKKLHKIVPEIIDLFVTPLVTVLVTGYCTLTIFGPVLSWVENSVLGLVKTIITIPFGIGAMVVGSIYAPTVVAGVHHMYNALEAGMLSAEGVNRWMPIATAANVGQGAAALAVALKTRNTKIKSLALPASLSAFLGITEPAIFGVNIRYIKAFVAGCIGGAIGGLVAGITGVGASAYGITGLFGFLITTENTFGYLCVILASALTAFGFSWLFFRDDGEGQSLRKEKNAATQKCKEIETTVYSPIEGEVIELAQVRDKTFSTGVLGQGCAIIPKEGKVIAPFDGTVETIFDTKHAIGIKSSDGVEVLIHVGINTVELGGEYFQGFVQEGDSIRKGQLLLTFQAEKIREAGYDITTPLIVTNSEDYKEISAAGMGAVRQGERVLVIKSCTD